MCQYFIFVSVTILTIACILGSSTLLTMAECKIGRDKASRPSVEPGPEGSSACDNPGILADQGKSANIFRTDVGGQH